MSLASAVRIAPPAYAQVDEERHAVLRRQIHRLARQRKALILAHNYQLPEVQDVAHFVGDSLGLALEAQQVRAFRPLNIERSRPKLYRFGVERRHQVGEKLVRHSGPFRVVDLFAVERFRLALLHPLAYVHEGVQQVGAAAAMSVA